MKLKTREDLIKDGKPCIKYLKGKEVNTQVFLTEKACKIRMNELTRMGYRVEKIQ